MDAYAAAQVSSDHVADNNNNIAPIRTLPERAASLSSLPSQSSLLSTGTQQLEAADVDLARSIDGLTVDGASSTPDVDVSILEALKSKDRLFVLKLGEQMEALIKERQCVFLSILSRLPYASCFERILLHTPHLSRLEARNGCISVSRQLHFRTVF